MQPVSAVLLVLLVFVVVVVVLFVCLFVCFWFLFFFNFDVHAFVVNLVPMQGQEHKQVF